MEESDDIHAALALMYGYAAKYAPSTVIEARIDALVVCNIVVGCPLFASFYQNMNFRLGSIYYKALFFSTGASDFLSSFFFDEVINFIEVHYLAHCTSSCWNIII